MVIVCDILPLSASLQPPPTVRPRARILLLSPNTHSAAPAPSAAVSEAENRMGEGKEEKQREVIFIKRT